MRGFTMLNVATLFSGIGGVEQALKRLSVPYRMVFACDNGDVEIALLDEDEEQEFKRLKKLRSKRQLKDKKDIESLITLTKAECRKADSVLLKVKSFTEKKDKKAYVDELYRQGSRQRNFVKISYMSNYDIAEDDFHLDVRFLDASDYKSSEIDLLVGGSPCQSFSSVGAQHGLDDARGTLFFDFARIIGECRPKVFIYENVRGLLGHDNGNTLSSMMEALEKLDYDVMQPEVLNASDFGIPQTRRRLFIVGFRKGLKRKEFKYPTPIALKYTMQEFLEDYCAEGYFGVNKETGEISLHHVPGKPDEKFILTPAVQKYVLSSGTKGFKTSTEIDLPIARTLMKMMTQHHRAGVDNYVTVSTDPLRIRQLSDREALRLMGFPDDFKIAVSSMQMLRQAGNSMVVDVIMQLISSILKTGVCPNV